MFSQSHDKNKGAKTAPKRATKRDTPLSILEKTMFRISPVLLAPIHSIVKTIPDIVFRLEKAFKISIPRGELFPEDILTNSEYIQDGKVTEAGLEELRKRMPFADLDDFAKNPVVQDFGNLLTVADMCRFVEAKLQEAA